MSENVWWGLAIVACLVIIWAPLIWKWRNEKIQAKRYLESLRTPKTFKDEWEPEAPTSTVEYFEEQSATDMPIEDFNAIFEQNRIIIEKDTFGYTTDWDEWTKSKARHYSSKHGTIPEFELLAHFGSFATEESFMLDGKVYAMDIREPKMFPTVEELLDYTKTLFAVYLVYAGVSPIDRTTKRYFIVGCKEEDGVIPTHGL